MTAHAAHGRKIPVDQSPILSTVNVLQRAKTLAVRCSLRTANGSKETQIIHLMRPNLLKISVEGKVITASGREIITTDENGRLVSKIAQTSEAFRAIFNPPSLRLWLAFFDPATFQNCKLTSDAQELRLGVVYDSVRATWSEQPLTGFQVLLDSATRLPKEATLFLPTTNQAVNMVVLTLETDPKFDKEEFMGKEPIGAAKTAGSETMYPIDWFKTVDQTGIQPLPLAANYSFRGNFEKINKLRARGHKVKLRLSVNGATYSENSFDENWSIAWMAGNLPPGNYKITLDGWYDNMSYEATPKQFGTLSVSLLRTVSAPILSVKQMPDGRFVVKTKTESNLAGSVVLVLAGKSASPVQLSPEMILDVPGLVPGAVTIGGTLKTISGFKYPLEEQRVTVSAAFEASMITPDNIEVNRDNQNQAVVCSVKLPSNVNVTKVDLLNDAYPFGCTILKSGQVRISKNILFNGENDLVLWLTLASGEKLATAPILFHTKLDLPTQRSRSIELVFRLLHKDLERTVNGFALAAHLGLGALSAEDKLAAGAEIFSDSDWNTDSNWNVENFDWASAQVPLTTDELFNEASIDAFKMAGGAIQSIKVASDFMSIAAGESGIIANSDPSNLAENLEAMVKSIETSDESAHQALLAVNTLQSYFVKYADGKHSVAIEQKTLAKCAEVWNQRTYQEGFLRAVAEIVRNYDDVALLTQQAGTFSKAASTGWQPKTFEAINDLVDANLVSKKLIELRASLMNLKIAINSARDRKTVDDLTKGILDTQAEIEVATDRLIQVQRDAWDLIAHEGSRLAILMDGLYGVAPKFLP